MGSQHLDFTKSPDTGDATVASIVPVADAEPATAAVFQRPSEALRNRTEVLRNAVEDLNYLTAFEGMLPVSGGGTITWDGTKFTTTADLVMRPLMAPLTSLPATLSTLTSTVIGDTTPQFTFSTRTTRPGSFYPLRAYGRYMDVIPGANEFSFEIVVQSGATLALTLVPPEDPRHYVLTVNNETVEQVNTYLTTDAGLNEFRGRFVITATPANRTQAVRALPRTYFKGAVDAEVHIIPSTSLATFFLTHTMADGDTLAIWYDTLWSQNGGGRKQSIADTTTENNAVLADTSLFIVSGSPSKVPYAIPVARNVGGTLVFAGGAKVSAGTPGQYLPNLGALEGLPGSTYSIGNGTINRVLLTGASGTGAEGGLVLRDGADGARPTATLDYTAAAALLNGADGNAYHTHTPLLQRWRSASPGKAITGTGTVMTGVSPTFTDAPFNFATATNNQLVEIAYNINMRLSVDTAVTVSVWLDGVQLNSGDTLNMVTDTYTANSDPDAPTYTLNGSWWVTVPTKGSAHDLQIKVAPGAGTLTIYPDSRVTLS
jgi:hypothetical protein